MKGWRGQAHTLATDDQPFRMPLDELQPSQLYISAGKLKNMLLAPAKVLNKPIPVKRLDDEIIMTDGHTRGYILWTCGIRELVVSWDLDELDWNAYRTCVRWCKEEGVTNVAKLQTRIVSEDDYQKHWIDRCKEMQKTLSTQVTP